MVKQKKSLYNKTVPKFIRRPVRNRQLKKTILEYYSSLPVESINEEERAALNYLKNNKLCTFPYPFQYNYKRENISVHKDEALGLKYILTDGKRLYFRRKSSSRGIRRNYNYLLMEQDLNSPHRYLNDNFDVEDNDILVDVGAAEGNLALSVIEKVSKVYLFETDEDWIEALEATFAPWKDKVEIINKFVSDINDERTVSLDQFFKDREKYSFLKIDVEGAENEVMNGCETFLSSDVPCKIAVCCYHKPNDEHLFNERLLKRGFSTSFSHGYMIFDEPKTFFPPYLRKGILRGKKVVGKLAEH